MDWVKTSERLPTENCPVLMSEPAVTWGDPHQGGGLFLGFFIDGEFQIDRPPTYRANPEWWVAITIPGE